MKPILGLTLLLLWASETYSQTVFDLIMYPVNLEAYYLKDNEYKRLHMPSIATDESGSTGVCEYKRNLARLITENDIVITRNVEERSVALKTNDTAKLEIINENLSLTILDNKRKQALIDSIGQLNVMFDQDRFRVASFGEFILGQTGSEKSSYRLINEARVVSIRSSLPLIYRTSTPYLDAVDDLPERVERWPTWIDVFMKKKGAIENHNKIAHYGSPEVLYKYALEFEKGDVFCCFDEAHRQASHFHWESSRKYMTSDELRLEYPSSILIDISTCHYCKLNDHIRVTSTFTVQQLCDKQNVDNVFAELGINYDVAGVDDTVRINYLFTIDPDFSKSNRDQNRKLFQKLESIIIGSFGIQQKYRTNDSYLNNITQKNDDGSVNVVHKEMIREKLELAFSVFRSESLDSELISAIHEAENSCPTAGHVCFEFEENNVLMTVMFDNNLHGITIRDVIFQDAK